MKRRAQPEQLSRTPLRLRRFRAEEWEAGTELEAAGHWWDARDAWAAETGESPDLNADSPILDAPFDPESI